MTDDDLREMLRSMNDSSVIHDARMTRYRAIAHEQNRRLQIGRLKIDAARAALEDQMRRSTEARGRYRTE